MNKFDEFIRKHSLMVAWLTGVLTVAVLILFGASVIALYSLVHLVRLIFELLAGG